jgi:hypothetical protein
MSFEIRSFKIRATPVVVSLATAMLAISLGSLPAMAANGDNYAKPHRVHRERVVYVTHRRLPYGRRYDYLSHVPADAIRSPGDTFVPGVGILGTPCDLPTSACPNADRID